MERTRFHRGTRGVSVVIMAIFLVVLTGMAALAIDLGMLQKARAEAQRAADAAALAGASAYLLDLGVHAETLEAGRRARQVADTNYMAGTKIDSLTELTVWAIPDSQKVRVLVRRATVPTWFARIFGRNAFPIGARAAAEADWAVGTRCVKPLAVPDLWQDASDIVVANRVPDPGEYWRFGTNPQPDTYAPAHYQGVDGAGTGLGSAWRDPVSRDWGLQLMLRSGVNADSTKPCPGAPQGGKCYAPGWWGLWGAANTLDERFLACTSLSRSPVLDTTTYSLNDPVDTKTGLTGVTQEIDDIIALDPGARWDSSVSDAVEGKTGTVVGSLPQFGSWRNSPRAWVLGIYDPAMTPTAPNTPLPFNNFVLFFVEGCLKDDGTGPLIKCHPAAQKMLVGRFAGIAKGTAVGPNPGTMVRILRLVE